MRFWLLSALVLVTCLHLRVEAGQFVVFPKGGDLVSPDGRYVVRNAEREASQVDLDGTFHALWLVDQAAGRSRKLCDYVGVAAVAWSGNDFLVVTEYVGKKTSRARVFPAANPEDAVILDKATLTRLVPVDLRPALRGNDHVFVEASRVEAGKLYLRVWGYGEHDAHGFQWTCEYGLAEGSIICVERIASHE
jgi:hypothetical protein